MGIPYQTLISGLIHRYMDYLRKPVLSGYVGDGMISSLANMETTRYTNAHYFMGDLSCNSPDFIEKT